MEYIHSGLRLKLQTLLTCPAHLCMVFAIKLALVWGHVVQELHQESFQYGMDIQENNRLLSTPLKDTLWLVEKDVSSAHLEGYHQGA